MAAPAGANNSRTTIASSEIKNEQLGEREIEGRESRGHAHQYFHPDGRDR